MSDQERISSYNINTISIQYQYNIKHGSDENKENYQLGDYWLIQYQNYFSKLTS